MEWKSLFQLPSINTSLEIVCCRTPPQYSSIGHPIDPHWVRTVSFARSIMSLLDINQILTEEERIPCVFRADAKGLGFMDPTVDTVDLPTGTRIELPMWLVSSLGKKRMVQMELPKHFESRMRDEIAAGAGTINFREYSQYFFAVGIKISKETGDKDLQRILCQAFCGERFESLMMRSLSR